MAKQNYNGNGNGNGYNNCPSPDQDPWFQKPGVKTSDFVADFTSDKNIFYGKVGAWVHEKDSSVPATVIDVDDAWQVDVHINVAGTLTDWLCCCGWWWCISCCLESMCGDEDYRFPDPDYGYCCYLVEACDSDDCCCICDYSISVPAYKVKESVCGAPYEATVIVTFLTKCKYKYVKEDYDPKNPKNYKPGAIATSVELPLLTFYSAEGSISEKEEKKK